MSNILKFVIFLRLLCQANAVLASPVLPQNSPKTTAKMHEVKMGDWHIRYRAENSETYHIPLFIEFDESGLVSQDIDGRIIWQGSVLKRDVSFRWTWLHADSTEPDFIAPKLDYIFSGRLNWSSKLGYHLNGTISGTEYNFLCLYPLNKPQETPFSERYEACSLIEVSGTWMAQKTNRHNSSPVKSD